MNTNKLVENLKQIITNFYKPEFRTRFLILFDTESKLSPILKDAYSKAIEELGHSFDAYDFYKYDPDELIKDIREFYVKGDVVIMLQSMSYRVSKFRWRNELCTQGLKVLEHGHLAKQLEEEYETFFESMTYDYVHQKEITDYLENKIGEAKEIKFINEDNSELIYSGSMDKCVRNIGEFENQTNWGSRFPIGELISESLDLSTLNGEMQVYAFPNTSQFTEFVEPFTCKVEGGFVTEHNGPESFDEVYKMIQTEHPEGKVYVRELGIGLNRGIKRHQRLGDPIAYERQEGLHFSLGMKHGIYAKKLYPKYGKKFHQKFHIDVFVNVKEIYIDNELVYTNEKGYFIE